MPAASRRGVAKRVALVPTGRMEWHSLATALQRLFPRHSFYALPDRALFESNDGPYSGFTSNRLQTTAATPVKARELVQVSAQEALGDTRRDAADIVVIVDDVELENSDQIHVIVDVMRRAVQEHLNSLTKGHIRTQTAAALRERVSFHLAAPMTEAWLFADSTALTVAGVSKSTTVQFNQNTTDPEAFVTSDAGYLGATAAACPGLAARNAHGHRKLARGPAWLSTTLDRARHPKGYLQWLCIAPNMKSCTAYSESRGGAEALKGLDWTALANLPKRHLPLLRALIEDLADALGDPPSEALGPPTSTQPTSLLPSAKRGRVLRNI